MCSVLYGTDKRAEGKLKRMRRLVKKLGAVRLVAVALAALMISLSASPATAASGDGVPPPDATAGLWFEHDEFQQAVQWAQDLRCVGPNCHLGPEPVAVPDCDLPSFVVNGSFLVRESDWTTSSQMIQQILGPVSVSQVTPNYRLLNTTNPGQRAAKGAVPSEGDSQGSADLSGMYTLQELGIEITPNSVHMYSGVLRFLPYAEPLPFDQNTVTAFHTPTLSSARGHSSVVTVDTGIVPTSNANLNHSLFAMRGGKNNPPSLAASAYIDPVQDRIAGHGPAIADLIADMMRLPEKAAARSASALQPIKTPGSRVLSSGPSVTFVHPDGVRAVDQASILVALEALSSGPIDYVNFSIGSKTCPELTTKLVHDPRTGRQSRVQIDSIRQWLIDHPSVTMIAAAGNSGSSIPTYPAAWTTDPDVPNIISVGSMGKDGTRSCFSGHAGAGGPSWVDVYAVGQDVVVEHPALGRVVWSGTSFAAPQVAAALATGQDISTVAQPAELVPPPSGRNARSCS